ncbi:hypothetical protein [Sporosarcina sp. A2]|uniref:hypothetical protein n=1 Tax=Sporosarcina sp. A2 TaxID=3393449 RepID=UPI003D7A0B95
MKGKTLAIGLIVVTILAVAAICFLVMATFKHDEQNRNTSMETPIVVELIEPSTIK